MNKIFIIERELGMNKVLDIMKTKKISEKVVTFSERKVIDYSYLEEWRNARTLLTDKYFEVMLEKSNLSQEQFAYALQPLNYEQSETDEEYWLRIFCEIMNNYDYSNINYELGVFVPTHPFNKYLQKKLEIVVENVENITISEQILDDFTEAHLVEMFDISGKTIALKLEEYKQSEISEKIEKEQKFVDFLRSNFDSKDSFYNFYNEFPVLARITTIRTIYLVENFTNMIQNIDKDYLEIQKFLDVRQLNLTKLSLSTGDSHERGKSVSILNFHEKKLVYKPKDLNISKSFEKFIDWYTSNSDLLEIKIPTGIYKDSYTYNEYIEAIECKTISEIENYYERYGYLIAICYLFSLNDLHIENIIAHGENPVIVDIETIFHVSNQMEDESLYVDLLRKLELESVSSSFLLPTKLQIGKDDSIDLSALSGKKVELNQKILGPVEVNTDNFHYQKMPSYFGGGNNIPKDNELESIDYQKYILKIIEGFDKFIDFSWNNKLEFSEILDIFKQKKTRVLLKGTERYMSMIRYSSHPSYNREMKYRERLMMNLWAYPYKNKSVVSSEVSDLLFNDIPIFYSYSDSRNLFDSCGHVFENYFETSGLQQSIDRVLNLSEKNIFRQRSILLSSLNLWDQVLNKPAEKKSIIFETQNFDLLVQVKNIVKQLKKKMITRDGQCSLLSIDCSEEKHWKIVPSDESLYSGLSGLALLFLELYVTSKETEYFDYYKTIIETAIRQSRLLPFSGAFTGWLSPIYPMILEYKYLGTIHDSQFLDYTIKKLSEMTAEQIVNFKDIDYISGLAGIIRLLATASISFDNNSLIKSTLEKFSSIFLEKIRNDGEGTMEKVGIAHGISGVMLSLASSQNGDFEEDYVKEQLSREFDMYQVQENSYKWCWGLSGMIQARLAILKISPKSIDKDQLNLMIENYLKISTILVDEDSLCHGNGSVITTMKMIYEYTKDDHWNKLADQWLSNVLMYATLEGYKIPSIGDVSAKGLFDGIGGIAWLYLSVYQPVNNVLLLEV